jgi:hypothetical protein
VLVILQIGDIKIENPVFLAPMAGITDLPYRCLIKEQGGCGLVYTEMVSAKGLVYGNQKTKELLTIDDKERPVALQLFGNQPEVLAEAAEIVVEEVDPELIDLNVGCPAPKIVNSGYGSALMKDPQLLGRIVAAMNQAVPTPITVKIRAGWDRENLNAVQVAKIVESNGAAALAVHGRTREEFYRGQADAAWELIPSLYRDKYYVGKEKNILADIRKHNYPEFAEQDLFINELVKMQHYGIPTPLLDWTKNPLNALFFAVSGESEKDGHVIVKQTDEFMKFNNDCYTCFSKLLKSIYQDDFTSNHLDEMAEKLVLKMLYNSYNQIFIDPIYENQRIRVQDGLFSVSVLFNHKIYDKTEPNLIKYILNNGLKKKVFSKYDHEYQGRIIQLNL